MFQRLQNFPGRKNESAFLWGARQTGKSTLLKGLFPASPYYDLLLSDVYVRYSRRPGLLREELEATPPGPKVPVIIDEVQKCPPLLDEIQWLIVNRKTSFILCGSSARKLKRSGANLLGGGPCATSFIPLSARKSPNSTSSGP